MPRISLLLLIFLLSHPAIASSAQSLTFSSGSERVHLLELYTSQGCSSCPPAEKWFGTLLQDPNLWQRIVPVAFHVDYWNYLGWKDPLSSDDNSRRQRQYKREGAINSVYTPGFVYSGREWRGWFSGGELPQEDSPAGLLEVTLENGRLTASYRDHGSKKIAGQSSKQAKSQALELQVALLGFDLTTQVSGGENRGKDLTHQFSVLAHKAASSKNNHWSLPLPKTKLKPGRFGLAVWVTAPGSQQPLQATGGWLP